MNAHTRQDSTEPHGSAGASTSNQLLALKLAAGGLPVFPCRETEAHNPNKPDRPFLAKAPYTTSGFKDATTNADQIALCWLKWPKAVPGVPTGASSGIAVIDGDLQKLDASFIGPPEPIGLVEILDLGLVDPAAVKVRTQSGGLQYLYAYVPGAKTSSKQVASHVDVRGEGGYIIAPGSQMANGACYRYEGRSLSDALRSGDLPPFPVDRVNRIIDAEKQRKSEAKRSRKEPPHFTFDTGDGPTQATQDETLEVVRLLLDCAPNTLVREDWVKLAMSLQCGFGQQLRGDFVAFSLRYSAGALCTEMAALHVWDSASTSTTITSIAPALALLKAAVGTETAREIWARVFARRRNAGQPPGDQTDAAPDDPPDLSHDRLALDLGFRSWDANGRHVAGWGLWLFWTGSHWRRDTTLDHLTRGRDYLRTRALELIQWADRKAAVIETRDGAGKGDRLRDWAKETAKGLRSNATLAAVSGMARANAASAVTHEAFDTHKLLVGTPGGTVDLRTGLLRPARREDMISRLTTCAPAAPGTSPLTWLRFLDEIFEGDAEIIAFLQRAAGYALTGATSEHKLLFLYGSGRNGKSVFLNTLLDIWGDYGRRVAATTFLHSQTERHPTDIAGLQGARLAIASELPRGKTWDEATIKDLTGGDRMTARFMRQDYFDFDPQLTLMIAGNTQPSFRGIDEAIRSRVVLVPFAVTIPPERRDRKLPDKLRSEGPAILRWAIDGALEWQQCGLDIPRRIVAASEAYFDEEDTLGQFLDDETYPDPQAIVSGNDLMQRFVQWCDLQGIQPWAQRTLIKELKGRGFSDARTGTHRGLRGLKLK